MSNQGVRSFLVGETVVVRARVSKPGTKTPTDPDDVMLATLTRDSDQEEITTPTSFTRDGEGSYFLAVATDGLLPDSYSLTVRAQGPSSDTPRKVVLATDRFVLRAA